MTLPTSRWSQASGSLFVFWLISFIDSSAVHTQNVAAINCKLIWKMLDTGTWQRCKSISLHNIMAYHYGGQRQLSAQKVAYPENPNVVPNIIPRYSRGRLDNDSRVTLTSAFEHELGGDRQMLLLPREKIFELREANGGARKVPFYLESRLADLRLMDQLQNTQDTYPYIANVPNGLLRETLYQRNFEPSPPVNPAALNVVNQVLATSTSTRL